LAKNRPCKDAKAKIMKVRIEDDKKFSKKGLKYLSLLNWVQQIAQKCVRP